MLFNLRQRMVYAGYRCARYCGQRHNCVGYTTAFMFAFDEELKTQG